MKYNTLNREEILTDRQPHLDLLKALSIERVSGKGCTYDKESVQIIFGHMGGNRLFLLLSRYSEHSRE